MKIPVLHPSRCTAGLPEDLEKEYLIGEEKLDGSRYLLYIGCDPYERQKGNALLSRRVSVTDEKHVDKTQNVPHITGLHYEGLEGTVLDSEIQSADFLSTNSIMNSSPALAIAKQNKIGLCTAWAFDVLYFRGVDVTARPLSERRKILETVVTRMGNAHVKCIPQFKSGLEKRFKEIVAAGGEGIIVKDTRQAYGVGWAKMKKSYDVSCIISGFKPGKGKYASGVGSIALSVFVGTDLVEIGFASGFDDKVRAAMSAKPHAYIGKVVDVYAQEIQKSQRSAKNPVGRLRHPTFYRFRDDIESADCTSEKLLADIATQAKSRRKREYAE